MKCFRCVLAVAVIGCVDDAPTELDPAAATQACTSAGYTPYGATGRFPSGAVADLPWRGPSAAYPDGDDFRTYVAPSTIECSDAKWHEPHFDVTDGCLGAIKLAPSANTRGVVQATTDGYFRVVALGFAPGDASHPIKWTDQAVEYKFLYTAQTGSVGNPGFKAFVRYRTEDDLYVASWRMDGVVQIQRKQCGVYTPLVVLPAYGAPAPNAWHTLRFTAVGDQLELALDGKLAASATSTTFSWGTAGIRIDSMNGAYLDDWRVVAP